MFDAYDMDAVILRHPLDGAARAVTENLSRDQGPPLCCFNGGDGKNEHPTQGLLDVFTIYECCGRLENLEIGIAVDPKYGRTTHSFPVLMSLFPGNRFHVFSPPRPAHAHRGDPLPEVQRASRWRSTSTAATSCARSSPSWTSST